MPTGRGHGAVAGHRGEHARLQLGGVGDDELPPGVGAHGRADARGQLERPAAAGRPPPGHHAAGHVVGAEPAVVDPRLHPRPPVGAEQARQLLVREQRLPDRVVELLDLPRPRRLHVAPGRPQPAQQVRLRVEVERRLPERLPDLVGQRLQLGRPSADAGRGPSRSVRSASCDSTLHGMPSCCISAAISAPVDSAASSSRRRPGSSAPATAASWLRSSSSGSAGVDGPASSNRLPSTGGGTPRPVPRARPAPWPASTTASRRSAAGSRGRAAGRGTARPAPPRPAAAGSGATCRPTPTAAGPPRARGRRRRGPRPRRRRSRAAHPGRSATAAPRRRRATGRRGAAARTRLIVAAGSDTTAAGRRAGQGRVSCRSTRAGPGRRAACDELCAGLVDRARRCSWCAAR